MEELDHLEFLGVDAVWITPFYDSPLKDEGYDIKNYKKILKKYGDMEIVEKLIKELKKRNIKVLLDLVPNHCSDQN